MSRLRYNRREAVRHLRSACPALRGYIDDCGPLGLKVNSQESLFEALASAIVYQQLSGKAAATIYGRFTELFREEQPGAETAAALSEQSLRAAGLSRNKALAIRDLAKKLLDGTVPSMRRLGRMADEEVLETLCRVRGIGPWTAQMFLIFNLGRPDVMPATDLGVQKAVQTVYGLPALPPPEQVRARTRHLAPFRSAASWYLWWVSDTVLMG